jgi:hypothetical protein
MLLYKLLDGAVTADFKNNYPELSYIHVFLLCTAISMVILNIVYGKKTSFSQVKEKIINIWKVFKTNPCKCMQNFLLIFALLVLFSVLISAVLGVTICTVSWVLFYVTLVSKLVALKLLISVIRLYLNKNIEEFYEHIALSP